MSDEFIVETARAWHIEPKKVAEVAEWVGRKVNPDYRALVFTNMLRRYVGTYEPPGPSKRTTRLTLKRTGVK